MKKVICAIAAFAMVGGVASIASAGNVDMSGSARTRLYYTDQGDHGETHWSSRVRVKIDAKTENGAYIKSRLRMADANWNGTKNTRDKGEGSNLYADYAVMGVKKGNLTLQGGLTVTEFSKFFNWDGRSDRFLVKYQDDSFVAVFTYDMIRDDVGGIDVADDDMVGYGLTFKSTLQEGFNLGARAVYKNDEAADGPSGFVGSIYGDLNVAGQDIWAEFAYKDSDFVPGEDNGMGMYAAWTGNFGTVTPTVTLGYLWAGYIADDDFGWIMIGGASAITPDGFYSQVGMYGDTTMLAVDTSVAISEQLSARGVFAYLDIDPAAGSSLNPWELSGSLDYNLTSDAVLSLVAGYLDTDNSGTQDDVFSSAVTLEVFF